MKKTLVSLLIITLILTETGCISNNEINNEDTNEQTVVNDQVFEGLEFVNMEINDGVITTVVINNTGLKYEGSKFSMKIMDDNGNIIVELTDEVKETMETGTTKTIKTKTKVDLSNAASIEYSILPN
jgi:hypothetical protein